MYSEEPKGPTHSFPDRLFKVWDYLVSHKQMVIRSLGPEEGSLNLDLHFTGVEYVRVPTILDGLSVVTPTENEIAEAKAVVAPRRCGRHWRRDPHCRRDRFLDHQRWQRFHTGGGGPHNHGGLGNQYDRVCDYDYAKYYDRADDHYNHAAQSDRLR